MIPHYAGYEGDEPLVDGSAYLARPLFWPGHLTSSLLAEEAQKLAWGPDWDAGMELARELLSPDRWPVFTVPVGNGCAIHVVRRNYEGDSGTDYLFSAPSWSESELLVSDDGHVMGPGLSWRELDAVSTDSATLLLLFPMLGDTDVPAAAADRVASALAELTVIEEPAAVAEIMLARQGRWGPAQWRERDGVWICVGGYSYRNPYQDFSLGPEQLAVVSAALNP